MTWFTTMPINPQKRGGRKLLGSPQAMHAAIMAAFPPGTAESGNQDVGRVLWRVDRNGHEHRLYIVSPERPDLTHVVEQAGWVGQIWDSAPYDALLDRLALGQQWAFRLTANPVTRGTASKREGTRGKVLPHVTPAQQTDWLLSKAARNGFEIRQNPPEGADEPVPDVAVSSRADERFGRRDEEARATSVVTVRRVQFDGSLTITAPEDFRSMLVNGLGRAKAYGCGLMTLKKLG